MAVAVAFIMSWRDGADGPDRGAGLLAGFRDELYRSLGLRRDALSEACDALACRPERVHMLAELCLEPECRRGHGGVYHAVNRGEVRIGRLRQALAGIPLRQWDDGRIRLACDVSNWLRPEAVTSPERLFCHCYARGKGNAQLIPGWPCSWIVALEPGRTSRALPLDAVRLGPADDATEVTAAQVREVIGRLAAAGQWREGDPDVIVVLDSGYDLTRLAWLLRDLPVDVTGRLRCDRVMYFPAQLREPGATGRPSRHGARLAPDEPATWPEPGAATVTETSRYGTARARARGRLHQQLAKRAAREHHQGELPVVEGTLIRLDVDHLPGQRDPHAADRWTWLVIAACARLWLARRLAADTRLPWQRPCPPGRHTPARVRRGFRRIRQGLPVPASAPKPSRPGPGQPARSRNQHPATRHNVGKTIKREEPKKKTRKSKP